MDNTDNSPLSIRQMNFDQYIHVIRKVDNGDIIGDYDGDIYEDMDDNNSVDGQGDT